MPSNPDDHVARYTSAQVCVAAGVAPSTLKNWVSRQPQVVLLREDERERAGKGYPILFSFTRVMQIALTAELVKLGFQPRIAAMAAAGFTDVSHGNGGWVGETDPTVLRLPGQLYPEGLTVLVVPPSEDPTRIAAECINITMKSPAPMLLRGGRLGKSGSAVAAIVDVNAVYDRVRDALNSEAVQA